VVKYGYNRDRENLKQVNLAMLSGKNNGLPVWYTPLPGSLNDGKTLMTLVKALQKLDSGAEQDQLAQEVNP
jgi:transposase